jgi:hypothetical protein
MTGGATRTQAAYLHEAFRKFAHELTRRLPNVSQVIPLFTMIISLQQLKGGAACKARSVVDIRLEPQPEQLRLTPAQIDLLLAHIAEMLATM